jgi:hypothetical protein
MKNMKCVIIILLCATLTQASAQEVILNGKSNRFLINEKSDKPRLDIIIESFTDYEKNVISKSAVMDIETKPKFQKVRDNEYNVTASRMGEKLTFVIRDAQKLEAGYDNFFDFGKMNPGETRSTFGWYILNGEKCVATQTVPFGADKVVMKLFDNKRNLLYTLNVTFSYPAPELFYVDIMSHYPSAEVHDTTMLRKFMHFYNKAPNTYSHPNAVPDRLVLAEAEPYFGFKKAYYDGKINPSSLIYKIAKTEKEGNWSGTFLGETPEFQLAHVNGNWTWLYDGKYKLYFRYQANTNLAGVYPIEIQHSWLAKTAKFGKEIFQLGLVLLFVEPWILLIIIGLILFSNYGNRIKKARDAAKKTNLELQAIQSQLNPHFVFNALGSVQGLINKNEVEKANQYLTDFSKLLRSTLNNNKKETVPLAVELQSLESYVKLEQLRFNFEYQLHVDESIEPSNVEVPSLLIQPLVENAIKHGIAGMGEQGMITISFVKMSDTLSIEIADNGNGFDINRPATGHGIKLTKERIGLLNKQRYKITLKIESGQDGSLAVLALKNSF